MIEYYCDRCKEKMKAEKMKWFVVGHYSSINYISKELCKKCYKEIMGTIEQWLKT